MQPDDPFQPLKPTSRWRQIVRQFAKPYICIPVIMLLSSLAAALYVLSLEKLQTDNQPNTSTAVEQPVDQVEKSEAIKDDDQKDDKKKSESKSKTKPTAPTQPPATTPVQPPAPQPPSSAKPNASNTGPRYSLSRTLSPDQALSELRQTGRLSRVKINGSLTLRGSEGLNWIIEDSIIVTSKNYGLQAYNSLGNFTGSYTERPIFRYVEIIGSAAADGSRCSAAVYGSDVVLQNADIYGCEDGIKASSRLSLINSWVHDNDHPDGAHCDALQIRSGTDILVRGSRLDAYVAYSSDGSQVPTGQTCSGALQTGSVTGTLSARFENNWFAGGHYTIRGWGSRDAGYSISYTFRNNKWMRYGTSVRLGLTNLSANRYGPLYGSLGNFDSSNVWEDTGQPVRN